MCQLLDCGPFHNHFMLQCRSECFQLNWKYFGQITAVLSLQNFSWSALVEPSAKIIFFAVVKGPQNPSLPPHCGVCGGGSWATRIWRLLRKRWRKRCQQRRANNNSDGLTTCQCVSCRSSYRQHSSSYTKPLPTTNFITIQYADALKADGYFTLLHRLHDIKILLKQEWRQPQQRHCVPHCRVLLPGQLLRWSRWPSILWRQLQPSYSHKRR